MHKNIELLVAAINNGEENTVKRLITKIEDINAQYAKGETLLHYAVKKNNVEIVATFLRHQSDINIVNEYGDTPLHLAAQAGNAGIIPVLFRHGSDIKATNHIIETALHVGAKGNSLEVVKELLKLNSDVNAANQEGDTPLHVAVERGNFNIINTLIFLPFAAPFIKLVERLLPGSDGVISRKPIYLDVNMLKTPSIAMTLAGKEVVRMGTMARHNVELSIAAMEDMDSRKIAYVLEHEPNPNKKLI